MTMGNSTPATMLGSLGNGVDLLSPTTKSTRRLAPSRWIPR